MNILPRIISVALKTTVNKAREHKCMASKIIYFIYSLEILKIKFQNNQNQNKYTNKALDSLQAH